MEEDLATLPVHTQNKSSFDVKNCSNDSCSPAKYSQSLSDLLKSILPSSSEYKVCLLEKAESKGLKCILRFPFKTKEEAVAWTNEFKSMSKETWRTQRTYPKVHSKLEFRTSRNPCLLYTGTNEVLSSRSGARRGQRVDLRCHHQTHSRTATADLRKGTKNTHCPASMTVKVKRSVPDVRGRMRSKDPHIPAYPTQVNLNWTHNHEIDSADVMRKRDVLDSTKQRLLDLFRWGHSPISALEALKYKLQEEYTNQEYIKICEDRAHCPDLQYCYRLFYKEFNSKKGKTDQETMLPFLRKKIEQWNNDKGEESIKMETVDGQTVVAICTPFMKRVHTMWRNSGELMFVDTSWNKDQQDVNVFFFLTYSPGGALPLGVLITSSQLESTLLSGCSLLASVFPDSGFFLSGMLGPELILTGDCSPLWSALHLVYPGSVVLLCLFHIMQAVWRWLWNDENGVEKEDRPVLLITFQNFLYCETESEQEFAVRTIEKEDLGKKYPKFVSLVKDWYEKKDTWSLVLSGGLRTRCNNTTDYGEAAVRVPKDKILARSKAFNMCQLTDFIFTKFEAYYIQKLLDVVKKKLSRKSFRSYFYPGTKDVAVTSIEKFSESLYSVLGKGKTIHQINPELQICTCTAGLSGAPCKHQTAVIRTFGVEFFNPLPDQVSDLQEVFATMIVGMDSSQGNSSQSEEMEHGREEEQAAFTLSQMSREPQFVETIYLQSSDEAHVGAHESVTSSEGSSTKYQPAIEQDELLGALNTIVNSSLTLRKKMDKKRLGDKQIGVKPVSVTRKNLLLKIKDSASSLNV